MPNHELNRDNGLKRQTMRPNLASDDVVLPTFYAYIQYNKGRYYVFWITFKKRKDKVVVT